jgi:hypothetical protein
MVEGELRVPEALLSVPARAHLEFRVDLARALPLLPARPRRVVVLHAMGFGPSEIACRMGYRPESVRQILGRGIASLQARLVGPGRVGAAGGEVATAESGESLPAVSPPSPERLLKLAARSWTNPTTKAGYRRGLRVFARWLGCKDPAAAIAELLSEGPRRVEEIIARYRSELLARGCAKGTVNGYLAPLFSVMRLAGARVDRRGSRRDPGGDRFGGL